MNPQTLKEYVVVQHIAGDDAPMKIWTKDYWEQHDKWQKDQDRKVQYKILATFSKDSPYQGSAGAWRSAAKPPGITQWYVVKCEQRRFASLIYVDSKITLERVAKDIDVEIDLLEWLDDSAASPAGDGLPPDLEEMIKREPVTFFLINALRYLDYKQRLLLIESLRERTIVEAVLPSPPNKSV